MSDTTTLRQTAAEAAALLESMGRLCSTQGGQLLKDAAKDSVKAASKLRRALDGTAPPRQSAGAPQTERETVAYLHDRGTDNKLSFSAEPIDGSTSYEVRELVFKTEADRVIPAASTPAAQWRVDGQPDPFAGQNYDGERARLAMGKLTDDELANAVFMYGNLHGSALPSMADVIAGKAHMPIAYLTAAKERIRWLSRALEKALAAQQPSNLTGEMK